MLDNTMHCRMLDNTVTLHLATRRTRDLSCTLTRLAIVGWSWINRWRVHTCLGLLALLAVPLPGSLPLDAQP